MINANSFLKDVQVKSLLDPTPEHFQEERDLYDKWMFLRFIKEAYFRQKSRIKFLKEGDFNTSYFHRVAVVRAAINTIRSFQLPNGSFIADPQEMANHAVAHFISILAPVTLPFALTPVSWFQTSCFTNALLLRR